MNTNQWLCFMKKSSSSFTEVSIKVSGRGRQKKIAYRTHEKAMIIQSLLVRVKLYILFVGRDYRIRNLKRL